MPKKILHKFKLDEISGVDRMAQSGARVTIMKRDGDSDLAKSVFTEALQEIQVESTISEAMVDMWDLNRALRESIETIVAEKGSNALAAVQESLVDFAIAVEALVTDAIDEAEDVVAEKQEKPTKSEGGKKFFAGDYAYVPDPQKPSGWKLRLTNTPGGDPDPRIVGAAVAALGPGFRGQKVQIPVDAKAGVKAKVRSAWLKANPEKTKDDLPQVLKKGDGNMPTPKDKKEETTPTMEDMQKSLTETTERLEAAELLLKLSPDARAHLDSLDEDKRGDFLKLDADGQAAEVKKADELAKAEDPVVYTDSNGEAFHKSDDPRLVRLAKQADEDRKLAKADREKAEGLELTKRAEDELGFLPGEVETKVSLLKAVETIPAETREKVEALLKANNTALESAFEKVGSQGGGEDTPQGQLDALAKAYAEKETVSIGEAMTKVLETEEGKRLYEDIPVMRGN